MHLLSLYKDFSFPLNVYAHVQMLREGRVDYLHYGLFHDENIPLAAAQQYSTEFLLSRLPAAPCRILEVGVGLGTTYALLTGKGYQVHGITPDAQQIAYIHEQVGKDVSISCQRLEDYRAAPESYDVVLFQESGQYINPLVIFNQALDLLVFSGSLLIIDEFALRRVNPGMEALHQIDEMIALAGRFGFELVERLDLSSLAAPTLDYLLEGTTVYRQQLIDDLNLQQGMLEQLDASNRAYNEKYVSGRYGYGLLHFKKKSVPRWRLRLVEEQHANEMMALFQRAFGHRMEPEMFRWKYGEGRGNAISVWEGDQMVAHYGGVERGIRYFGQPSLAVQNCDVMVDRSGRGSLTRQGPLFLAISTFLERSVGYGKTYLLGFGFPSERAWKAPHRLGLYGGPVGHMFELAWSLSGRHGTLKTSVKEIDLLDETNADLIRDCWATMEQDLKGFIVGVRDRNYLVHRYGQHPEKLYRCFVVRQRITRKLLGIFVLRQLDNTESYELVDVIGTRRVLSDLIFQARRVAAILGGTRLVCWVSDSIMSFFGKGAKMTDLGINIPTNVWTLGPAVEEIAGHWWVMGGDVDFR